MEECHSYSIIHNTKCENYRGISLLRIAFKIIESVLLYRLRPLDKPVARDYQAGFCSGRGCRSQIFALRQILEQRNEYTRKIVMVFIDFKSAFDSIDRSAIWQILEQLGLPQKILAILKEMYTITYCQIRACGSFSEKFVTTGV